jgi:hypothetical protein
MHFSDKVLRCDRHIQLLGSGKFATTYLAFDMTQKPKFCIVHIYDFLVLILNIL